MSKILFSAVSIFLCSFSVHAQNVGIGTTTPVARLHVADSNVVFTGPSVVQQSTAYAPPVQGPGTRMMWYPQKAAFRAGGVNGNQWDKGNIGNYSFATGLNSIASADGATAMGWETIASGLYSTTMGRATLAYGENSTALGYNTFASGISSTAMGNNTSASANYATSMGFGTKAYGEYSTSMGFGTYASSFVSTAMGAYTTASGYASTAMGYNTIAKSSYSLVVGNYNDTTYSNRLFEIGNGTADNARSNALTVLNNGNTGIGNTNPARPLSFPASLGEKILLYPGSTGEVGIGVYGNELRLHSDNPGAKVSFGTQDNAGVFTENAYAQRNGAYAFIVLGSLWVNGTTYASDERFKQNITSINSPLQKLMQLKGVEYEMKVTEFPKNYFQPGRQMGLLAQDVEKVAPEAVSEKDGYKGVDYARLVPLLIESIKELKKEVEELKNKKQ